MEFTMAGMLPSSSVLLVHILDHGSEFWTINTVAQTTVYNRVGDWGL